MSTKLSGKVAVILGATGIVGSGAVYNYLTEGATVVGVGRDKTKLAELAKKLGDLSKHFIPVVFGDYGDEKAATSLRDAVYKALPKDHKVDHVLSSIGFVYGSESPSKSGVKDLKAAFEDGLYPNLVSVQAFLPDLKTREGSTFSFVSGGLAHFSGPDYLGAWTGSLKGAAINALYNTVTAEVAKDGGKTRIGNYCIHYGVSYPGSDKNQWGMPAINTNTFGACFTAFATGSAKGRQVCYEKHDLIKDQIASYAQ